MHIHNYGNYHVIDWMVALGWGSNVGTYDQEPLLLTWINYNSSMDKKLRPSWSVEWKYLFIPKLQRCSRWSLGTDKYFHSILYWACDYLFMPIINVSKRGPRNYIKQCYLSMLGLTFKVMVMGCYWVFVPTYRYCNLCNPWGLGMEKLIDTPLYSACDHLSMPGLKLNHVSKSRLCTLFSD